MGTKSKNDFSVVWSVLALLIAAGSIVYCFSAVLEIIEGGWERSAQLVSQIARIIGGNVG